jgi:hypothetical protein
VEVKNQGRKGEKQRSCQYKEFIREKSCCDLRNEDECKFFYGLIFCGNIPNHTLSVKAAVFCFNFREVLQCTSLHAAKLVCSSL